MALRGYGGYNKIPVISLILAALMLFAFGCDSVEIIKNPTEGIAHAQDLMKNAKAMDVEYKTDYTQEFIDSTADFSIEMFKQLSKEENAVYSPTPLYIALALVMNGAEGKTRAEIEAVLTKHGLDPDEINIYYKSLMDDLTKSDYKVTELSIANSIWFDSNRFKPNMDYFNINKTYFSADAYSLNFSEQSTVDAMNKWVQQVTRNRIDKMIEEISEDVVMYLFSSIYFKAKWEDPFNSDNTYEGKFYVDDDTTVSAVFMYKKADMKYYESDKEQAVILPYKDGRFAYIALLPNEGIDIQEYIKGFDYKTLSRIARSMKKTEVSLNMPKYEIEYGKSIVEELKALGIKEVFDEYNAQLDGMGTAGGNLFVSDITQKTYIRVDEEGTEAASVVKVEVSAESVGIDMTLDRPFVYAILDMESKLPIFLGVLNNPEA